MNRALAQPRRSNRLPALGRLASATLCALLTFCPVAPVSARPEPAGQPVGAIPAQLRILVSGEPASGDFLAGEIERVVTRAIASTLAPGGTLGPLLIRPAPQALDPGFMTSFRVDVAIVPGPGAQAVAGSVNVTVQNAGAPRFSPVRLGFRDDPERIVADGVLSRTTIDIGHPTRVYYYHQNMGVPRRFCVLLSVNDSVRSRVQVVAATAGPDVDVMSVGHAVTRNFLRRQRQNEGAVVDLAGGRPILERDTPVAAGEGIVGSTDVRVLFGGPVTLTVMAIPVGGEPANYVYAAKLPDDGHQRRGLFDLAGYAQSVVAYTAGGPDVHSVYGRRERTLANLDPADPGRDYGDYGVVQQITFDIDNPSERPATLYLYEKPLGGVVRSSFLANGQLFEVGCVRVAQRYEVTHYELGPRTTAQLDIRTMTDGGSNYPLEIGLTATPPTAIIPSISAPDGCFPKPAAPAE